MPLITVGVYSILPNAAFASGYSCQVNLSISSIFNIIFNFTSLCGYSVYPEVRKLINFERLNNIQVHTSLDKRIRSTDDLFIVLMMNILRVVVLLFPLERIWVYYLLNIDVLCTMHYLITLNNWIFTTDIKSVLITWILVYQISTNTWISDLLHE